MSLRRSARVQAVPNAAATLTSQLKVTKRKPASADAKLFNFTTHTVAEVNGENNTTLNKPLKETPRKRQKINDVSPLMPTSSIDSPMAVAASSVDTTKLDEETSVQESSVRPAEPHIANAPIKSPTSDKIVTAYSAWSGDIAGPAPTSTTNSILDDAVAHLKHMDENGRLAPYIAKFHCKIFDAEGMAQPIDPFRSLASGIISQQVSGAAASSIKKKFVGLFEASEQHNYAGPPDFPPPAMVAVMTIPTLRTAGLSQRKAEYIQGLAEQFANGKLSAEMLATASDEEVMEKLIAVRGLGKWSVEMFACFDLKRMNVFSTGDLGVQ
jgi:DNA-3-methyladenine glycosylase II